MIVLVSPYMRVTTWRVKWPAAELRRRGYPALEFSYSSRSDYPIGRGDTVLIHVTNQDVGLSGTVRGLKKKGARPWLQFDDDYFSLGDMQSKRGPMTWHMAGPHEETKTYTSDWWTVLMADMIQACREADGVIGSTPTTLAAYSRWIGGQQRVIRNWLPRWVTEVPIRRHDPPLIGWMGTMEAHFRDIGWLAPAIDRLRTWGVVGDYLGVEKATGRLCDWTRPVTLPPKLYRHVGRITVGLAPLRSDTFNAAKSWIKALEYGAMDAPCVAIDHVPYRELRDDGYPLVLVSTPEGMADQANRILDTMPERGGVLREHVRERYTLEARGGDEWEEWADAVA